jgi:hypothetical protein
MRTYKELVDLARRNCFSSKSCANSARFATSAAVAYEFWQMAMDYQESAAKLSGGKLPDIGNPPIVVVKTRRIIQGRLQNSRFLRQPSRPIAQSAFSPILLRLPLRCWRIRIFDLNPMRRTAP